jgi:hypothetical protein
MLIISHRGFWKSQEEKNSIASFERSFRLGFGVETDIRDRNGEIVISHDPSDGQSLLADKFFSLYARQGKELTLALNIKADGLQMKLASALSACKVKDYFAFDMSIPDMIGYIEYNIDVFTRQSEVEITPVLYEKCKGVWIDCLNSNWIDESTIRSHLRNGKKVCLVSPELHRRPHKEEWERLRKMTTAASSDVILCTDYPEQAREYFL